MSRPEDPLGGKSHLASQSPGQMSDQARPEEIERHRAADAQAMPSAQARIENAINDIRSNRDRQPTVVAEASTGGRLEVATAGCQQIARVATGRSFR